MKNLYFVGRLKMNFEHLISVVIVSFMFIKTLKTDQKLQKIKKLSKSFFKI